MNMNSVFGEKKLSFVEKGLQTELFMLQGLDLTILQRDREGKESVMSHYSNPGINTFVVLLKFLYIHNRELPSIPRSMKGGVSDFNFELQAEASAYAAASLRFPIKYPYWLPDFPSAKASINTDDLLDPKLNIRANNDTIVFSLRTAKKAAERILIIYPDLKAFKIARDKFVEEASKHRDQIVDLKELRRQLGTQLQFDFDV
ncbi:MAG: hypothetical protein KGH64_04620 [Candidatus Micrarchaeota archaeon]|nr:hypothetical protein [Candidatus Micrarchaeota archaeon]MDE1834596.1 hypothetical protein [Candidatus Micrarchaeota archaeon]MDE1860047.1 hypothetical protein [Candidatus Micrarchaeota archaeon]